MEVKGGLQHALQPRHLERLGDVVKRPASKRPARQLRVAIAGDHDHCQGWLTSVDRREGERLFTRHRDLHAIPE
jgi:hypothetical protein